MIVLGEVLRRHARGRPRKTAYVIGVQRVTYAELNRTAVPRQVQKTLLHQMFQRHAART